MTRTDAIITGNHREFISNPDWWPIFGICPVTRRTDKIPLEQMTQHHHNQTWEASLGFGKQTGVIVSANLLEVRIGILGYTGFSQPTTPILKYANLDELLADGWVVD